MAGSWARWTTVSVLALALAAALPPTRALAQDAEARTSVQTLSLRDALSRASGTDPALAAANARAQAAEASVRQADVRPNPTLGLMVENLPTLGGGDILGRTETTLTYEQRIERGGDRPARVSLARAEGALVAATARVRRLDRLEQVQKTWAEALAAEADVRIARERLDLAERFQTEVQRRVTAARDPLFAGARAEAELAQAQIDFDQAEIAARVAKISLAKFWDGMADFNLGDAAFEDTNAARILADGVAQADLDIFLAQRDIAVARVAVEQARRTQDATVSVGVRHFWEGQDLGLVVGGSIRSVAMTRTGVRSTARGPRAWPPRATSRRQGSIVSARSPASRFSCPQAPARHGGSPRRPCPRPSGLWCWCATASTGAASPTTTLYRPRPPCSKPAPAGWRC